MNIASMRYFKALAEEGNFTKAAAREHVTQQSLSSSISSLEKELGAQLVERSSPVRLTHAGESLLRHVRAILLELQSMEREVGDIAANRKGVLSVGVGPTRGLVVMPRIVKEFQLDHPGIAVNLVDGTDVSILNALRAGDVDLAIAKLPLTPKGIETVPYYQEEVVLAISNGLVETLGLDAGRLRQALAGGDFSMLESCPFLLDMADNNCGRIARDMLESVGFEPVINARCESTATLVEMSYLGVGACFAPSNLVAGTLDARRMGDMGMYAFPAPACHISFGYQKTNYHWSVISDFIDTALRLRANQWPSYISEPADGLAQLIISKTALPGYWDRHIQAQMLESHTP